MFTTPVSKRIRVKGVTVGALNLKVPVRAWGVLTLRSKTIGHERGRQWL
jgi:hypothetical protein